AVLGTALLSQYWGGLQPCELCLLQRWPWDAAIVIALVAALAGGRSGVPRLALIFAAGVAASSAFAFYHVAVEQQWFAGPSACAAGGGGAMTLEDMRRQILGTTPVMCDRVQWSLFGVSLAGWNLLASLIMTAIGAAVFALFRPRRARAPAAA